MAAPFSLAEARAAGLTLSALRGRSWERVGFRVYRWKGRGHDTWSLIHAFRRDLPAEAVFVGLTAAWMHGLDVEASAPVHVALPAACRRESRLGLDVRHADLNGETVEIKGAAATTLDRTLLDLCAELPPVEALVAIDMAILARLTDRPALSAYAASMTGRPGVVRLRRLAEIAAPAESPMETRLRWLLLNARLPAPEVQTDLYDESARFLGRADLYYPTAHLVIEFDGAHHRERLVTDDRRQNALLAAGYRILRFTTADLQQRPDAIAALVKRSLTPPAIR